MLSEEQRSEDWHSTGGYLNELQTIYINAGDQSASRSGYSTLEQGFRL